MTRRNEIERLVNEPFYISIDSSGASRLARIFYIIPVVIVMIIGFITVWNNPEIREKIPRKDPYNLIPLQDEREKLYNDLASGEDNPSLYFKLANSAFLQGEIYESEYFLSKCPDYGKNASDLKIKIKSFKNAKKELDKYLYEKGNYFDGDLVFTGAYGSLEKITALTDEGYIHVRHLFMKGYLLLREGRRSEARVIFDDLKKNGGTLAETSLYMYGKTFMEEKDKTQGIESFREYIKNYPKSRLAPLASVNLALILNSQNRPSEAFHIIDSAIVNNPESEYMPELLIEKSELMETLNDPETDQFLADALKKYPSSKTCFKKAIEIFDSWAAGNTKIDRKKLLLAVSEVLVENERYYQSKQLLDALKTEFKGLDLSYTAFLLAKRHYGAGDESSALNACQYALKVSPDNDLKSRIYSLMAEIYGKRKDVASVESSYLKASDANGSMSDLALREIGRIAYDNGWRVKAWDYYKKLYDKFPDSPYVSEALNYLVVMAFYQGDTKSAGEYAAKLAEKGSNFEDRLKGKYYLRRLGLSKEEYFKEYPLAYYSFSVEKSDPQMYLPPEKSYPDVNKYKNNLGWEYFLAGCYDLAEREYQFNKDDSDQYRKMAVSYLAYFHRQFKDGIILTRDFTDANMQSKIEKGYSLWFYEKAFPMDHLDTIEKLAPQNNFPASTVLAIIRQESFFHETVKSSSGALGLMQIMPATGKFIADSNGVGRSFNKSKLTDPETNIKYGIWYLDHLRNSVGTSTGMILAGHNAGPGNLKKWQFMFPVYDKDPLLFFELMPSRQTRNFVRHVTVNQRIYEKLYKMRGEDVRL